MELNLSMDGLDSKGLSGDIHEIIRRGVEICALEWQNEVKRIISDSKVDTGEFLNSVHYEIIEDGNDFIMKGFDGVNYGIYIEQGTVEHWVPFFKFGDTSQPSVVGYTGTPRPFSVFGGAASKVRIGFTRGDVCTISPNIREFNA